MVVLQDLMTALGPSLSSSELFSTDAWDIVKPWLRFLFVRSFRQKAFDCVASPMLLGKRIMATPGHVKDGLTNHCSLQPPDAYVLATFMLLLCILGAWFVTSSRWMTMCSLPVSIAPYLTAMHDINLDSNFGAARLASQPQDMMIPHGATKPVGSPLPKDVFG